MSVSSESIEIAVNGQSISGTILTPGAKIPGILFVHGWGGSQQRDLARAKNITGLGCVCLTFDLRGHERTHEMRAKVSREQSLEDLLAAYDRLVSHPAVDSDAIAVIGSSYGGYLATILSSMRPVKWLALRVPALYWDADWEMPKQELDRDKLAHYRRSAVTAADNRALAACPTRFALKLDSDDAALPSLTAAYAVHLATEPAPDVLGCQFTAFGDGHYTTRHPGRVTRHYVVHSPGYWFVNHTGVLLNRDSVLASGGYRTLRGLPEDYDLWIRMMRAGFTRFANLGDSLVAYRDSANALHRNFRRGLGRFRLMGLKAAARLLPPF